MLIGLAAEDEPAEKLCVGVSDRERWQAGHVGISENHLRW